MADVIRLGPTTVTVEEAASEITVSAEDPTVVAVGTTAAAGGSGAIYQLAHFSRPNLLTVAQGSTKFVFPMEAALFGVTASVKTAPVGSDIILDVNVGTGSGAGVSTFEPANRPKILEGETVGSEATNFLDATIQPGDWITVDIDQVGSTTPGDFLGVTVRYQLV